MQQKALEVLQKNLKFVVLLSHDDFGCCKRGECDSVRHIRCDHFLDDKDLHMARPHDGRNIKMQNLLLSQHKEELDKILGEVKQELWKIATKGLAHDRERVQEAAIHFVCSRGRDRSVAICEMVAAALRGALPEANIMTHHWSLFRHKSYCSGGQFHCRACYQVPLARLKRPQLASFFDDS